MVDIVTFVDNTAALGIDKDEHVSYSELQIVFVHYRIMIKTAYNTNLPAGEMKKLDATVFGQKKKNRINLA